MRHSRLFTRGLSEISRISVLMGIGGLLFFAIAARLFSLQIVHGEEYAAASQEQHFQKVTIPAKRGEILTRDQKTGGIVKLATNTTLDLLYIDPTETPDKAYVARTLAPLLFTDDDFALCKADFRTCPLPKNAPITLEILTETSTGETLLGSGTTASGAPILPDAPAPTFVDTRTREELTRDYAEEILRKIDREWADFEPIKYGATDAELDAVFAIALPGISVDRKTKFISANPQAVPQAEIKRIATALAASLSLKPEEVEPLLVQRKVRYVAIKRRLSPDLSDHIWEMKLASKKRSKSDAMVPDFFRGVVLVPEHWRFYPQNGLASQVVGFTDRAGNGQYGLEAHFDDDLRGEEGLLISQNDVLGGQITIADDRSHEAKNGTSLLLSIDLVVQKKVEEILKNDTDAFHADSAQAIVMNPKTGEILAMAGFPSFDPNTFGEVYDLTELKKNDEWYPSRPTFVRDETTGVFRSATEEEYNDPRRRKYRYKNRLGPGSYVNKTIMEIYEPGSVFKPLAMSAALDVHEVEPSTKYNETGPIIIDTGTGKKQIIRTSTNKYLGWQTMTNVLETSSNIGMAFVANRLGKAVFHQYILDFGFGDYTGIELYGEQPGTVAFWKKWTPAQLMTSAFGQGIAATPLQMITAWSALANGGFLLQPHLVVATLDSNGALRSEIKPKTIRRVVSPETHEKIVAMLVSSVEKGYARKAKVPGYYLAGKTGTSQIAKATGGYEAFGEGNFYTSFAGFAPPTDPKFIILVKFDRARMGDSTFGENTAAVSFRKIAEFLFRYYDIPPDDPKSLKKD